MSPNTAFFAVLRHIRRLEDEEQRQDSRLWRRINRSLRFRRGPETQGRAGGRVVTRTPYLILKTPGRVF